MKQLIPFMIAASFPSSVLAEPLDADDIRCTRDSLSVPKSKSRIEWAVRIQKQSTRRTRSGNKRNIRYNRTSDMLDYWEKQGETALMGRPVYPTYMIPRGKIGWDFDKSTWRAYPTNLWSSKVPDQYIHAGYCTSSCFYPGMKILLNNGYIDIKFARDLKNVEKNDRSKKIIVLDKKSTLENPKFSEFDIAAYSAEISEEEIEIHSLFMKDATVLRVTGNHIFIDKNGRTITAAEIYDEIEKGRYSSILNINGKAIVVDSVDKTTKLTNVYNVRPDSKNLRNNILVVEGYLTGSSYLQNIELDEANDHLLVNSMAHREVVNQFLDDIEGGE